MTTTVHVSRTFKIDTDKNPEVLEELRRLAARGFEVLGPIDLTPVQAVAAEPEPEPEPQKSRVAEICDELAEARGLSAYKIGALIGANSSSVYNWRRGRTAICAVYLERLERLLKRSRALPEGSTTLCDEAKGAIAAGRRAKRSPGRPSAPLSDETRLEIAVLREQGRSIQEIKKLMGVGASTVYRALKYLEA